MATYILMWVLISVNFFFVWIAIHWKSVENESIQKVGLLWIFGTIIVACFIAKYI